MKRLFLHIFCTLSFANLFCQNYILLEEDLIVLKSGKSISCKIIANEKRYIRINFSCDEVLLYNRNIDYILQEGVELSFIGGKSNLYQANKIEDISELRIDTI